ncbi:protein Turandot M-like [Drosophila kikkawai]|uniref:Protein Turandot M-like n=1 Tax=Drosophila kikkawai TaxID=30033 RepID=A0A6P4I396_DROKI|nr:protein Turandot M-like isoform X3 [Drosophila kikkawai]
MNPTISLSCLVLIIGSLLWTASADFDSDRQRVIEYFKNADPSSVSDSQVFFLVEFLAKHINDIELTTEQRSKAEDIVKQYNEEKANPSVALGGWIKKLVRAAIVQLGIELASEGVKKATKSKD